MDEWNFCPLIRFQYGNMVCNVLASCKANRDRNQLGAWLYSDQIDIIYIDRKRHGPKVMNLFYIIN